MTSQTTVSILDRRLVDALATVAHARGSLEVTVGDERLEADTSRDLRQTVSGHLYNFWHTGLGAQEDVVTRFYRDVEFESVLGAYTPLTVTPRQALLLEQEAEGSSSLVTVRLDGVRVAVPASAIVQRDNQIVTLEVDAARPSLSPGFWLADGSRGRFASGRPPLRVYVSITEMQSAPMVWHCVLTALEAGGHLYRAKVGSGRRLYPRADALVVYLDGASLDLWDADGSGPVADIVRAVHDDARLGTTTSVYARRVARGVAIASEPNDPRGGMSGMSFGQHRCYAVASGILDAVSDADVFVRVRDALVAASVDPMDPSRNLPVLAATTEADAREADAPAVIVPATGTEAKATGAKATEPAALAGRNTDGSGAQ